MDVFGEEGKARWDHLRSELASGSGMVKAILLVGLVYCVMVYVIKLLKSSWRWIYVAAKSTKVPTAPENNSLLGHVLPLAKHCAWEKMYEWLKVNDGNLVKIRIGHRTGVLVGSPEGLKRVFQTRYKLYEKDLDFSYKPFLSILGTGLVTANGDHWQRQRILMAPALRVDMLDAILPIAQRAADRLATKLEKMCEESTATQPTIDIEEELRLLTLQVIGEAILSLPPEECDRVFPALYLPVMEESNRRVLQPWRYLFPIHVMQYNARVNKLNNYIIGIIRERRSARILERKKGTENSHPRDILDRILTSVEERGEKWSSATEMQLCYEIKTFLLAGHETSAAMLTWTFYELARKPEALQQVQKEADKAFGKPSSSKYGEHPPERQSVENMTWTLSCLKESLRKYSVVPVVTRDLVAEDTLCGYKLPAGSWIICHLEYVHHLYKNPLDWHPQRFMPGDEYDSFPDDIRPYMFVPFIQGPRNCLGQYFALMEARVVLGSLCQRLEFTPVDPESQGKTHPSIIPIGPVHGMEMKIKKRS